MILAHTRTSNTRGHAVVCADYLTVYTTTSASDVLRPRYRMDQMCVGVGYSSLCMNSCPCLSYRQNIPEAILISKTPGYFADCLCCDPSPCTVALSIQKCIKLSFSMPQFCLHAPITCCLASFHAHIHTTAFIVYQ